MAQRATNPSWTLLHGSTAFLYGAVMGVSASLQSNEVGVTPGSEQSALMRVRNTGGVVDQFTFQSLGDGASWISVDPPQVSLFPGAEETVQVLFRPPRTSAARSGSYPFAVKILSREEPGEGVVEEGVVSVDIFDDRNVELFPQTSRGRNSGRFEVAVDNRGNAPITVALVGSDPENQLGYAFSSPTLAIPAGTAQITKLRVRPPKRIWKGPLKTYQFQVDAEEPGASPQPVAGAYLQEAVFPPWIVPALLGLLVLLIVLFVLWQTLFKPSIKSTAKEAVKQEVSSQLTAAGVTVAPTTTVVGQGPNTTAQGGGPNGAPTTPAGQGNQGGGPGGTVSAFGNPIDFRLAPDPAVAKSTTQSQSRATPDNSTFFLTDIVLQNPDGNVGRISIRRDQTILLTSALENLRDLDFHFVAPYEFDAGKAVTVEVFCSPDSPADCTASASFAGYQRPNG
jgi:hypothetical protein